MTEMVVVCGELTPDVTGIVTEQPTLMVLSETPMPIPTPTDWLKHSNPEEPDALDLLRKRMFSFLKRSSFFAKLRSEIWVAEKVAPNLLPHF